MDGSSKTIEGEDMKGFLQQQVAGQIKGTIFFSEIRKTRRKEIETKKSQLTWGAPDYKIYPSSINSWNLCPKEFIKSLENPTTIENLDAVYRVKRGSSVHRELQFDFLGSDKLYPAPTNIDNPRMQKKLREHWPEVCFHDTERTGISGSIDGIMEFKGRPTIVEIKTTSIDPKKWEDHCEKMLPMTSHIIQVCIYQWELRELNYYKDLNDISIIAYQNLLSPPGDQEAEKEYQVNYSEYCDKIEQLILNLADHRKAYINKVDLPCEYKLCRVHRSK